MIPFCITLEEALIAMNTDAEREAHLKSLGDGVKSALDKIVQSGYQALQLITFFTSGPTEVRGSSILLLSLFSFSFVSLPSPHPARPAWPIQAGTKAPQAAGEIHGDFEEHFIRAEVRRTLLLCQPAHVLPQVMSYADLKELGSEAAVKAAGKYSIEGKNYEVKDGDVLLIKHGAGSAKKK